MNTTFNAYNTADMKHLTIEEATDFFSELYDGAHHIPGRKVLPFGHGFMVKDGTMSWATFDFNRMTRFVIMCHDKCIRGEIMPHNFNQVKVSIFKRQGREGSMCTRHPTMEDAIKSYRPNP